MKQENVHIVPKLSVPIRLQEYGVALFEYALTKSALKKVLKKRCIRANDVVATTATVIKGGERIILTTPKESNPKIKLNFKLEVLFEDEYMAVIHKPAGILVSGNKFKTIANALPQNINSSNLPDTTVPQPVHRLDYATTGILLVGKTSSSIRALNKMFDNKAIEKIYYAISIGEINDQGEISLPIDNKKSHTNYTVIKTVPSVRFGKLNLIELNPKTGRRHQLRKHLSCLGSPILGDKEYGIENFILNGKGLYLHAFSIEFVHPFTKETIYLKDELVQRFEKIFGSVFP
ncbi:MAG: RluA family pseudouridine synthase [Flavobacteriales bacterium]|nr:RluA family pseudouridine synthase [Flavobacteriales bacterium]